MKTLFWIFAFIVLILLFWVVCGIESLRGRPVDINEIYKT